MNDLKEGVTVSNVYLDEMFSKDGEEYLRFTLNEKLEYHMRIVRIDEIWKPRFIMHDFENRTEFCPLCKRENVVNRRCTTDREVMCRYLINHPSIRLKVLMKGIRLEGKQKQRKNVYPF